MANFTSIVGGSVVNARDGMNIGHVSQLILTQSEYDTLETAGTLDSNTLYFITEN